MPVFALAVTGRAMGSWGDGVPVPPVLYNRSHVLHATARLYSGLGVLQICGGADLRT